MAKFILRIILFSIIGIFILNFVIAPLFLSSYWTQYPNPLFRCLLLKKIKSEIPKSTNTLILGGSVGGQIFGYGFFDKRFENSYTSNAATSMIGQYFFVLNAISHNKNIKYIILAMVPYALSFPFEHAQGYSGILKSFYTFENLDHFSKSLKNKMNSQPLSHLIILPMIKTARCFSDIVFDASDTWQCIKKRIMSDITIEYLKKIKDLTIENNVKLLLVCPPVAQKSYRKYKNYQLLKKQVKELHFEDIFKNYFRNMIYLKNDCFIDDGLHYKKNYFSTREDKVNIISRLLPIPFTVKNNILNIQTRQKKTKSEKLIFENITPSEIMAGQPFKPQLKLICRGNHFTNDTVIVLEQGTLKTTFVNNRMLSAKIPDILYEEPGDLEIYLYDRKTRQESEKITLKVKPPLMTKKEILSQSFSPPQKVTVSKPKTIPINHSHFNYRIEIEVERKDDGEYWGRWQINWYDKNNKFISTSLIPFKLDKKRRYYVSPVIKNIPSEAKKGALYLTSHDQNYILIHSIKLEGINVDFTKEGR